MVINYLLFIVADKCIVYIALLSVYFHGDFSFKHYIVIKTKCTLNLHICLFRKILISCVVIFPKTKQNSVENIHLFSATPVVFKSLFDVFSGVACSNTNTFHKMK